MRQHELAQVRVECEASSTIAHRQHQHGGRAVQGVTSGHLLCTGLQKIFFGHIAATVNHLLRGTQHRKNTADRHVHIDIGRTVQGVKHQHVFAARKLCRNLVGIVHFFRGHARQMTSPLVHAYEQVVAQHIEFLLGFALHIDGFAAVSRLVTVHAAQLAHGNRAGNRFASQRHIQNQRIEVTT